MSSIDREHRVFIAILPNEPVRAALANLYVDGPAKTRWTPPEQLHLSLRFVGGVSGEQLQGIAEALSAVRVEPFPLGVEGVGRFPQRGRPSVIWAGVGTGHPLLHQLRQQVDDRLLSTGVPFELRSFIPHFTIGRTVEASEAGVAQWTKRHRAFLGPVWQVDAFHLMTSELSPTGAIHRVAETFRLGGGTS